MVLANKTDLNNGRAITFEEAKQFCDERQLKLFETSALSSSNIEEAFESLIFSLV